MTTLALRTRFGQPTTHSISGNGASPWRSSNSRTASTQPPRQHKEEKEQVEPTSFSFKDLGMSPTVKIVVYTALGIIGTAETITYGTWGYYKLFPKKSSEDSLEKT